MTGVNLPVTLHGRMRRAFEATGQTRLTKTWVREYLRTADLGVVLFRNEATQFFPGTYVGAALAVANDLTLEVHDDLSRSVAMVNFQLVRRDGTDIQAVVR